MTKAAIDFLRLLYPAGIWCLSAATPDRDKLDTRSFSEATADQAEAWISAWNGERNLYFHVGQPRDPNARKKLKRTDVASVNYLHVDLDPAANEAADAAFRSRALGLLQSCSPEPTVIVFSGGGFQALWKLDAPIVLDGSPEQAEEAKLYNLNLEQKLGGDSCHNIDRLMRLPGTMNVPGEIKRAKGREPTLAALVLFDESRVYPISAFKKGKPAKQGLLGGDEPPLQTITDLSMLDQWKVPMRVRTVIAKGRVPGEPKKGDDSRSAWLYDCICQLIRFAVPDHIILSLLLDKEWLISASVLDKGPPGPEHYARRQVEKAHADAIKGEHSARTVGDALRDATAPHHQASADGDFIRNQAGVPYPTQDNIRLALQLLGVTLQKDRFSDRIHMSGLEGFGPMLTDDSLRRLWLTIDERYHFMPKIEFFTHVITDVAVLNSFHPVLDYLNSLKWDGTARLDEWLIKHAGAADTEYTRAVSRLLLLAAVRRVRRPGCEFDEILVLISPHQGKGKSKSLKRLCPDENWFCDDLPLAADSKVILERLSGKWIVEAAELKGMRKSDAEHMKSFLSRCSDRARLAYGRFATEVPRQFVMFGTTNSRRFLQDPTGNRRYWPIDLGCDMVPDAIAADRDQLWAEASVREATGESIRLSKHLYEQAGVIQRAHRVADPIFDMLQSQLDGHEGIISSNDIWSLIEIPIERRANQSSVVDGAMQQLDWESRDDFVLPSTGKLSRVYVKGSTNHELSVVQDSGTKKHRITATRYEGRVF